MPGRQGDYVVMELEGAVATYSAKGSRIGSYAEVGNHLVIPGFNAFVAYDGKRDVREVLRNWTNYVYWDGSDGCMRSLVIAGTCVLHSCITMPGQSGAPVFGWDEKKEEWVDFAVHSGSFHAVHSCATSREESMALSKRPADFRRAVPNMANQVDVKWVLERK